LPHPRRIPLSLRGPCLGLLFFAAWTTAGPALADASLAFRIAVIEGEGWQAHDLEVMLFRDEAGRLKAGLSVARLALPPPLGSREALRGECRELRLTTRQVRCSDLRVRLGDDPAQSLEFAGQLTYRRDTGALAWDLVLPAFEPGAVHFTGSLDAAGWRLQLAGEAVAAGYLGRLAAWLGFEASLPDGFIDLSVTARGRDADLDGLVFALAGHDLASANPAGTAAAEGIGFELSGSAWPRDGGLAFDARGTVAAGEIYLEPVYASLAAHPLRIVARGHFEPAAGRLRLGQLVIDQAGTVHADIAAVLTRANDGRWALDEARLKLVHAELPGAYEVLARPFLAGTPFAELETAGTLGGELTLRDGAPVMLRLALAELDLDDRQGRLAAYGVSGDLAWTAAGDTPPSVLGWSGGFVYGIPFGAAQLELEARERRWVMAHPVAIPLLDGALEIAQLEFADPLAGDPALLLDARLTPLGMRELSMALGWSPLAGRLSGVLPSLNYRDGLLTLDGDLSAELFHGTMTISGLRIERPFQALARLQADVELRGLELETLTEALAFGLMTGRLDGHVYGLELIDWAPVAFDARLYTAPDDRRRKRISQRAVDNIASLGGGGAGALSTGFLRFFESFSYEAFALGCRLERDVCQMSGLEPRNDGYLILRGSGLPRIEVMGFAQHVSWSALVEQLAGILEAEGPEIR
jgi:hypothetical protein